MIEPFFVDAISAPLWVPYGCSVFFGFSMIGCLSVLDDFHRVYRRSAGIGSDFGIDNGWVDGVLKYPRFTDKEGSICSYKNRFGFGSGITGNCYKDDLLRAWARQPGGYSMYENGNTSSYIQTVPLQRSRRNQRTGSVSD